MHIFQRHHTEQLNGIPQLLKCALCDEPFQYGATKYGLFCDVTNLRRNTTRQYLIGSYCP